MRTLLAGRDFGDQRVGSGIGVLSASGSDKGGPPVMRQSRGEDDNGTADFEQPGNKAVHQCRGVGIIGVHFVNHNNLATQGKEAKRRKLHRDDRHERLIQGPNTKRGEHCAAAVREPSIAGERLVLQFTVSGCRLGGQRLDAVIP